MQSKEDIPEIVRTEARSEWLLEGVQVWAPAVVSPAEVREHGGCALVWSCLEPQVDSGVSAKPQETAFHSSDLRAHFSRSHPPFLTTPGHISHQQQLTCLEILSPLPGY